MTKKLGNKCTRRLKRMHTKSRRNRKFDRGPLTCMEFHMPSFVTKTRGKKITRILEE